MHASADPKTRPDYWSGPWGIPPWTIDFQPRKKPLPESADFVIIGGGFTGLAAAAWLRLLAPDKSVVVLEGEHIGSGASGRTGGQFLGETAAGDQEGLGDVIAGVQSIFAKLSSACGFSVADRARLMLPGAWEIARKGAAKNSPIQWNDSGTLRVVGEVPGGTIDPGGLVSSLGQAAENLGAEIFEDHYVEHIEWAQPIRIEMSQGRWIRAGKLLAATNGLSLEMAGYGDDAYPKLTLAVATAPIPNEALTAIGLAERKPFYTVDFPYLWGRVCADNSIVWGAGLVDPPPSRDLRQVDVNDAESTRLFTSMEKRVRGLHPALREVQFTHHWGGPILFREGWLPPVLDWHPASHDAIVLGAYTGHGVALSSYLGSWAAEALLGRRELPKWAKLRR
ncbi:MAG TPA: FAD-binding oxidoreductase [Candidatus Acidoferrales bacterium]|nr:FAD-binding oxidoreductase [Candidatus Acidoferrales bacterium]